MDFKTSYRILSLTILFSKNQNKLKTVQLITKRKKLSAQRIVQQIANSLADFQTKEIIYSIDLNTT